MPQRPEIIDQPYQLVCEGPDDVAFFERLVRDRAIQGCQVGCGKGADGRCLGKDGFEKRIDGALTASGDKKGFLIIADNDDDPSAQFKAACKHLQKHKLAVPKAPWEIASLTSGIRSAVLTIPSPNAHGSLETILLGCCDGITAHRNCIDNFCNCIVSAETRAVDAHKFRLRALIAATNVADPSLSVGFWMASRNRPFDMSHTSLDSIADFIVRFTAP